MVKAAFKADQLAFQMGESSQAREGLGLYAGQHTHTAHHTPMDLNPNVVLNRNGPIFKSVV